MVDFDTVSNSLTASDTVADCLDDGLNLPSKSLDVESQLSLDIMRREEIRLQTFLHWPTGWDEQLARFGFCSISNDISGTVRCVFCGLRVSDFASPQEANLRHWQSARNTCPFLRGDDVSNIPRNERSQVVEKTPPPSQTILLQPTQPLRASARVPRAEGENRLSSAGCTPFKTVPGSYAGAQTGGSHSQPLKRSGPDSPVQWQEMVRTAHYPRMASYQARLKTLSRWPLLKPSPTELAKAGFFHVRCNPPPTTTSAAAGAATSVPAAGSRSGECGDSVKCFWCGERIHRWQETDDAVLEHARLSPSCLYVRQVLGQQLHDDIVHGVISSTTAATGSGSSPGRRRDDDGRDVTPFPVRPYTTEFPTNTSRPYRHRHPAPSRLTSSQLDDLMQSPPVQTVLQMGFPPQLIRNLLSHNSERLSAETLCNLALQAAEQTSRRSSSSSVPAERSVLYVGNNESKSVTGHGQNHEQTRPYRFQSCGSRADLSGREMASSETLEAGRERSGRLMCKVCSEAEVRVMFRPCNHLVCCSQCKALFTSCPVCHQIIEDVLVVYLT